MRRHIWWNPKGSVRLHGDSPHSFPAGQPSAKVTAADSLSPHSIEHAHRAGGDRSLRQPQCAQRPRRQFPIDRCRSGPGGWPQRLIKFLCCATRRRPVLLRLKLALAGSLDLCPLCKKSLAGVLGCTAAGGHRPSGMDGDGRRGNCDRGRASGVAAALLAGVADARGDQRGGGKQHSQAQARHDRSGETPE